MSKPKTSLWGYSFITSLVFNPPFPMSVLFLKRLEVLEKSPTCFDIYSVTSKQEDVFLQIFKECLNFTLIRHNFFHFWPLPPWKMRTSYMDSPCSRTYCSYSQLMFRWEPFHRFHYIISYNCYLQCENNSTLFIILIIRPFCDICSPKRSFKSPGKQKYLCIMFCH